METTPVTPAPAETSFRLEDLLAQATPDEVRVVQGLIDRFHLTQVTQERDALAERNRELMEELALERSQSSVFNSDTAVLPNGVGLPFATEENLGYEEAPPPPVPPAEPMTSPIG